MYMYIYISIDLMGYSWMIDVHIHICMYMGYSWEVSWKTGGKEKPWLKELSQCGDQHTFLAYGS